MNGTSAQTIPAATFSGNLIKGLIINNTSGVTLGGALNLTDVLTVSNGALATGDYLTLKSSATATARVAQITSVAATPISGNVTVERYVPGRRKYRLITSSVTTHSNATLIAGQEGSSIWGNWQNGGNNVAANTGTIITGGTSADGFDIQTGNASLFTYDDVNRTYVRFSTINGKNTKYTPLKAGVAYYMFVYGDRTNTITTSTPNNTVIKSSGTLLTGNQTYNSGSTIPLSNVTDRYTMLGNPFASAIDWSTIQRTNLSNSYWGWDPNMSSTGGYVTVSTTGTVTIISPFSGSTGLNQYIQPGQGFFVKTTAASPVLTIREQDKVGTFNASAFRGNTAGVATNTQTNNIPLLAVNLQYASGATKVLADGVVAAFDAGFSNGLGAEDAAKMSNTAEAISIKNGADLLSIECRQMPQNNDTLFLNLLRINKPQYTLQIFAQDMFGVSAQPYLQDKYLNTVTPLQMTDTNNIVFNVDPTIPASSASDRFKIIFNSFALPVRFTTVNATVKAKDVQVDWEVASESLIKKYQVERSADGAGFTKVAEVTAKGINSSESYSWLDKNAVTGNNYYRIRAIQTDGENFLTRIVLAKIDAPLTIIKIVPNPVVDHHLNIQLNNSEKAEYTFLIVNAQGQLITKQVVDHRGGTFNQVISLNKNLKAGVYYLHVVTKTRKYSEEFFIE